MVTISFDTETTGLDLYHGARPYFFTLCIDGGGEWEIKNWEWPVNPKTRVPIIPHNDIRDIRAYLDSADVLVAHNSKFDVTACESIGMYEGREDVPLVDGCEGEFPWEKVEDTLVASHMLYTSRRHDLTSLVTQYLNDDPEDPHDIETYEHKLRDCVERARRETRRKSFREVYGEWNIAKKGQEGMPSAKGKCWQMDMWLPLAVAVECEYPPNHPWYTVLEEYATADSEYTLALWYKLKARIGQRKLWDIYRCRMDVIPVGQRMERNSVTGSITRTRTHKHNFETWRKIHIEKCTDIANEYGVKLKLPDSGTTPQLSKFVFETLGCPIAKRSGKTGEPSLDKDVLEHLVKTARQGDQLDFLTALQNKRKCDTAISYLTGYEKYWIPINNDSRRENVKEDQRRSGSKESTQTSKSKPAYRTGGREGVPASPKGGETNRRSKEGGDQGDAVSNLQAERQAYFRMHPNLNPCGTVQLRWSSSNPNEQNISKQEGYNLRYVFGPEPDREWWSLDYQNLELRIPTFESREQALMEVFLKPKDPPYFGSYHLVVFDALHPERFKEFGVKCKDEFESTWYQWVKNGNFAMIYGCGKRKADATYKVPGAFDMIRDRFPNIARLSDRVMAEARKYGYVQTIPDRSVDVHRGFPIMASRTDSGDVLPTTPLNYHVSGTACWCTAKAMIRTEQRFIQWRLENVWDNLYYKGVKPAHSKMQVHDELVFDFPKSKYSPKEDLDKEKENKGPLPFGDYKSNLGFVRVLQKEMEKSGDDIGMPLPVGVEYNESDWATVTLKC